MNTGKVFSLRLVIALGAIVLLSAVGCGARGRIAAASGVAVPPLVEQAATHWFEGIERFHADALVTRYDEQGRPQLTRQVMDIDLDSAVVKAVCILPQGSWTARQALGTSLNPLNWGCIRSGWLPLFWGDRHENLSVLELILHRVRGPLNLRDSSDCAEAVDEIFAAGFSTWRLSVDGGDMASGYFFDMAAGSLKMVSSGGVAATQDGTITVYRLGYAENGAVIPVGFEVRRIGVNSLIGVQTLLSVDFENIVTE